MNSVARVLINGAKVHKRAQGLVEYGFILGGVALVALVALFALGPKISAFYVSAGASLQ